MSVEKKVVVLAVSWAATSADWPAVWSAEMWAVSWAGWKAVKKAVSMVD